MCFLQGETRFFLFLSTRLELIRYRFILQWDDEMEGGGGGNGGGGGRGGGGGGSRGGGGGGGGGGGNDGKPTFLLTFEQASRLSRNLLLTSDFLSLP